MMLPGRATLTVCDRPPVGVNTAEGFDVMSRTSWGFEARADGFPPEEALYFWRPPDQHGSLFRANSVRRQGSEMEIGGGDPLTPLPRQEPDWGGFHTLADPFFILSHDAVAGDLLGRVAIFSTRWDGQENRTDQSFFSLRNGAWLMAIKRQHRRSHDVVCSTSCSTARPSGSHGSSRNTVYDRVPLTRQGPGQDLHAGQHKARKRASYLIVAVRNMQLISISSPGSTSNPFHL